MQWGKEESVGCYRAAVKNEGKENEVLRSGIVEGVKLRGQKVHG